MNRLSAEKSAYLRHSASQKIDWYPWSDEAFRKAEEEDKPVFLSSGAIWCHWCHVMARECFENEEIINFLNEHFISIKLDRDERPDIDKRYQHAVSAMGSGSGWPLSVFLTPERRPFFGGTYFPPDDRDGRPGFRKILAAVVDFYRTKRKEVNEYTGRLAAFLQTSEESAGTVERSLLDRAEAAVMSGFDPQNGGFGTAPKFPMPGAMEFLINRFFFHRRESTEYAVRKTLASMARGGIHDQIGGGFHRYSVDGQWIVPHFEKMADDNAWHLRNYISAYSLLGERYFRTVAEGIISFLRDVLCDRAGGFYASQDADVSPDDEGGYFTWREEDFGRVLDEEEYRILSLHLLSERGSMHHDPTRKVLFIAMEPHEISKTTGIDLKRVMKIIKTGRSKLLDERQRREAPFVDRNFYTSINGMLVSAFLCAFRTLRTKWLRDFALLSLERILEIRTVGGELFHSEGVKAVFEDYIFLVEALIDAYEVTGNSSYLNRADDMMETCIRRFWDGGSGGFFDTETEVLGVRLKAFEDMPHPSPNAAGIIQLLRLHNMTSKAGYYARAEEALGAFAGDAAGRGVHTGYYFCAVDAYFTMIKLMIEAPPGSELSETAIGAFVPYRSVVHAEDRGCVTPCLASGACLEPIREPERLKEFLKRPAE